MSKQAKHVAPKQKKAGSRPVEEIEPEWVREAEADASGKSARAGKKKGGVKKGIVAAIVVVAVLVILLEVAYLVFGHLYNKLNYSQSMTESERASAIAAYQQTETDDLDEAALNDASGELGDLQASIQEQLAAMGGSKMSDKDVINVLLVGTDARESDEKARSDVMMVASLNKKTHKIILTSFMRDIYTYIPDYGYNRLNAAYAIAGADMLIDTLEDDFGIEINNYAAVNFYDFADIVDAIDGIDIDLEDSEVDFINEQAYWGEQAQLDVGTGAIYLDYSPDGNYHLNGTQALAHCRNRSSSGSDFDRTSRQRTVISTMIEKAKTISLTDLYALADTILPMISTNLTQGDCLALLVKSPEYLGYEIVSMRIPTDTDYTSATINGMSVLSIDFTQASQLLKEAIYG